MDWEDDDDFEEVKNKFSKSTFKRILPFFKGHGMAITIAIICVLLATGLNTTIPMVFKKLIDVSIPSKNIDMIIVTGLIYLGILILQGIVQYFEMLVVGYMGIEIVNKIKRKMLRHVLTLSIRFYDKTGTGRLLSRIESDAQKLYTLFSSVGLSLLGGFLNIVIALSIMFYSNTKLTLLVLTIAPVYLLGTYLIFTKMRPMFRKDRELYANVVNFLGEHLKAITLLRNLNNVDWSTKKFNRLNDEKRRYEFKIQMIETSIWFTMMLAPQFVVSLILYNSVGWIKEESITIGMVWMFIQYIQIAISPLIMISEQINELQRSFGAADKIFEILDTEPEVKETTEVAAEMAFSDSIKFENVSFHYDEEKPVLKDLSFEIKKGSTVAIVGSTGSGKTTIISLLTRFYDPIKGKILIDGNDIRTIKVKELRKKMSLVLQDIFLFPGNVLDNLRVLRQDIDEKKVRDAAKAMGIHDYIEAFPKGFQTELAEDGGNLSFGERQLLSFSRALTFEPEILIMDEATSSIDPYTEAEIQRSMKKLVAGRTSIIIAHRLSTITDADKILVLDHGYLKEQGSHEELLSLNGIYAKLYCAQNGIV